jgi:hypothetical protein
MNQGALSSHPVGAQVNKLVAQLKLKLQNDTNLSEDQRQSYLQLTHTIESLMSSQ